jgi:hypothetical protein
MKTTYFVTRFDVSILQRENFITKYSQNNRFFFQILILTVQEFCGFKFLYKFLFIVHLHWIFPGKFVAMLQTCASFPSHCHIIVLE